MSRNAWMTIWNSPRETIRKIVAGDPRQKLWLLAGIYGFAALCSAFQSLSLGSVFHPLFILFLAIVLAPLWGYIFFAVWSFVIFWIGKLLKGRGTFDTVRAAYAWSCVPMIVSDAIWLLLFVLFGGALFISPPMEQSGAPGIALFFLTLLLIKVVCAVWSLVIYLNALSEVQKFSILRSIGNVALATIVMGAVLGFLCVGIAYLAGPPLM